MYEGDDEGTRRVAVRGISTALTTSASRSGVPDSSDSPVAEPASPPPPRRRNHRRSTPTRPPVTLAVPRRVLTRTVAVIAALAVLGCAIALMAWTVLRDRPQEAVTGVRYPATPPAEWSADALWRSPALLPKAGPAVVIGGDRVAVLTAQRRVLLIEAATGATRWSAPLPAGEVSSPLASTTVDGQPALAVQLSDRLAWWRISDGTPGEVALPTGARATYRGEAPLIGLDQSTVAVVQGGRLRRVAVPQGALAMAARTNGTVTAAADTGWWHLRADAAAGPATPWEPISRQSIRPTVIAYTGAAIITVLPGKTLRTLVYSDRAHDIRFSFGGILPTGPGNATRVDLRWTPSPSREWGILSRSLIDLTRGRVVDLGAWTTRHITSDRALGTIGTQYALVGPLIRRGVLLAGEGFPEELTTSGALVRSRESASETLYLLPPRKP